MKQTSIWATGLLAVFWFAGCQHAFAECGLAGSYAPQSRVAHGNSSSLQEMILGAHRSLPPGTRVIVRNQQKGRSIIVQIFGPALSGLGEIINLSAGAMRALGMGAPSPVCLEVLTYGSESRGYRRLAMRNLPVRAGRLEKAPYAEARGTKLAHEDRHWRKAHRRGNGKRYAKLHRHGRTAKKSSRRRGSARG